jgi:hypothetical protein
VLYCIARMFCFVLHCFGWLSVCSSFCFSQWGVEELDEIRVLLKSIGIPHLHDLTREHFLQIMAAKWSPKLLNEQQQLRISIRLRDASLRSADLRVWEMELFYNYDRYSWCSHFAAELRWRFRCWT